MPKASRAYRQAHKMGKGTCLRTMCCCAACRANWRWWNPTGLSIRRRLDRACNITDNIYAPPEIRPGEFLSAPRNVYGGKYSEIPTPLETRPAISLSVRFDHPARGPEIFHPAGQSTAAGYEKLPLTVEVSAMPPLGLKRVTVTAGNEESERKLFEAARPPGGARLPWTLRHGARDGMY